MTAPNVLRVLATLVVSATTIPVGHAAGPYVLTIIEPVPGYESCVAYGLNEAGQVVGWSYTYDIEWGYTGTAFLFDSTTGEVTDLGLLDGGQNGVAEAINEAGQIVGWSFDDIGADHAILWDNGQLIDIGIETGQCCAHATDINDAGQIAGWWFPPAGDNYLHAFLWDAGTITDLGELDPNANGSEYAYAINNSTQLVGESQVRIPSPPFEIEHPFVWTNGTMDDLNPLGPVGVAYDLNEVGQIVGVTSGDAAVWEDGTRTCIPSSMRVSTNAAFAINNNGLVVGEGWRAMTEFR